MKYCFHDLLPIQKKNVLGCQTDAPAAVKIPSIFQDLLFKTYLLHNAHLRSIFNGLISSCFYKKRESLVREGLKKKKKKPH